MCLLAPKRLIWFLRIANRIIYGSGRPANVALMAQSSTTVYENERYYGLTWRPPALLERPKWSDTDGGLVENLGEQPSEHSDAWAVEVTHSTDIEGWQYGSVFKHLEYSRPGGRAERRVGDFVRRRKWIRRGAGGGKEGLGEGVVDAAEHVAATAQDAAHSLISPVTQMQGIKVRKQTEMERRKSLLRTFFSMLTNTFKRRQLWSLLPMDPTAWYFLLTAHQSRLLAHQAATLASAALVMGPSKPRKSQAGGERPPQEEEGPLLDSADLLRQLVCAAVHSRAAYGHAMAAGHLSSLYNFALLQTLHQLNFNPVGGASGEANNEAVAALAGIPVEDIRLAEWNNSVMRPCHFVAVDRANHCIVVAIRGSLEAGDILMDLTAKPMEVFGLLGTEGLVHEGMMAAATYVQCNTGPALERLAEELPGWPVCTVGHSMGGSVATILALLMRSGVEGGSTPQGLGPIRCVAMGPAPVFSRPLAEACNSFVTSVVNGADVVPRISYASVEGLFLEVANSSTLGHLGRKVSQTIGGFKANLKPPFQTPSLPSLTGLANFVGLADDKAANAKAARTAQSAAASAGSPDVEMSQRGGAGASTSGSGRDVAGGGGSYGFSNKLSHSAAQGAAQKLARLREQAGEDAVPPDKGQGDKEDEVGEGRSGPADHAAAADILDTEGKEFRDNAGHPEPLYVAGRILWLIPPRERAAASSAVPPAEQLSVELQLGHVNGSSGGRQSESAALDTLQAEDEEWMQERQRSLKGGDVSTGPRSAASDAEEDQHQRSPASKRGMEAREGRAASGQLRPSLQFPSMAFFEETDDPTETGLGGEDDHPQSKRSKSDEQKGNSSHPANPKGNKEDDAESSSMAKGEEEGSRKNEVPSVYEVDRSEFEDILLTMEMMQDHLPGSYLDAVNQL